MYFFLDHSVGPVLSGEVQPIPFLCVLDLVLLSFLQIYQRFRQGWTILNFVVVAIIIAACAAVALFTGERPLARRLREARPALTCKLADGT
jgi:hypothetical protein